VLGSRDLFALDLSTGTPDPALLPDVTAALRRVRPPAEPATYLDEPVLPELAELLRADWPFAAERLTVVDGAMDALQQVVATHLRFGDRVAVEQPCFPPLLDLLDASGVVPVPVGLDGDGPLPHELRAAVAGGVRALFLQPRAQNPSGASLTRERAGELAAVLSDTDVLVVEDDSAGAVAATPVHSLGTVLPARTLHVRSYSKSHGPDLRLAAVGGPAQLLDPVVDRRFLGQGWTSRLLQSVLVDLLTHAPSVRVVQRAQRAYAKRRAAIVTGLAREGIAVGGKDGLNIWLPVQDESAALLLLATRGIGASAGGPFAVRPGQPAHLRVTAGLVATGHRDVVRALADAARAPGLSVRR
jgi:DNA-binding transcriptional MocR family regulator